MERERRKGEAYVPDSQIAASSTECTGLMPALPRNEAEDQSSAALYGIHSAEGVQEDR